MRGHRVIAKGNEGNRSRTDATWSLIVVKRNQCHALPTRGAALDLWLEVNGVRHQNGSTQTMVFGVAYLISYLSRFMTLHPGDIISTGTPPGVALGMATPRYLRAGDEVRLGIDGLGEQRQRVVASE